MTASLTEMRQEVIQDRLTIMGRLLDATMSDDAIPHKVAQAFLEAISTFSIPRLI